MAALVLSACDKRAGDKAANARGSSQPAATADDAVAAPAASGGGTTAQQQQWFAQAQAFMARPEQQRDVLTALRARAMTHPEFCPDATYAPKRIDILFDPVPRFSKDGTMVQGEILQRFTMQGCAMPVLLSVSTVATPGRPLRFIAGLPGTTFADMDLQQQAVPIANNAARALLAGCERLGPIDTRLIGAKPDASGALVPWTEYWLVAGCGRMVNVKVHFTPNAAAKHVDIAADPRESSIFQPGASSAGHGSAGAAGAASSGQAAAPVGDTTLAGATGTSLIPLNGAPIPGAKVAGTCLLKLREAGGAAPDNAECTAPLPASLGATTQCTATRGQIRAPMTVTVTNVDASTNTLAFRCAVTAP